MPWLRTHPKQKPDKPIEARTLRMLAETCDWISRIKVTPPLELTTFGGGPLIRFAGVAGGQVAYTTSGGITARSGTTAGTGSVYLVATTLSSGVCTLTTASEETTVYNFSGASGGIAGGKYCWVEQEPGGLWFVVSSEC
jgi:hypothetical protein